MEPIRIDPARALDEAVRTQSNLAAGVRTLQQVEDVDYGVTDKEAIYREDKLVVYRFKARKNPPPRRPT